MKKPVADEEPLRLIVFDLDGVLVETKRVHFEALNQSLLDAGAARISWQEHLSRFDGLDTESKLDALISEGRLTPAQRSSVWSRKQAVTRSLLRSQEANKEIRKVFRMLREAGIVVGIASNSIRATVDSEINRLGLDQLVNFSLSNEDVSKKKPHPEIYWRAMITAGADPTDTLILEDSGVGRRAAMLSGAKLVPIDSPSEITTDFARTALLPVRSTMVKTPWSPKKLNVLIPMAGAGQRFADAGYSFPKPLIEVFGQSMIELVVRNLNVNAKFIFCVRREHLETYNLESYLRLLAPGCKIVVAPAITEGAASTALLAEELIDDETPLLIANSDQFVDWDSSATLYQFSADGIDGGIVTFQASHPKWSFAEIDDDGFVKRVAEKDPISNVATTGIYYWAKGSDFVKYAKQMISADIRTNGEFYICPVYNQAVRDGARVVTKPVDRMWGLGTPEDLQNFVGDNAAAKLATRG